MCTLFGTTDPVPIVGGPLGGAEQEFGLDESFGGAGVTDFRVRRPNGRLYAFLDHTSLGVSVGVRINIPVKTTVRLENPKYERLKSSVDASCCGRRLTFFSSCTR